MIGVVWCPVQAVEPSLFLDADVPGNPGYLFFFFLGGNHPTFSAHFLCLARVYFLD